MKGIGMKAQILVFVLLAAVVTGPFAFAHEISFERLEKVVEKTQAVIVARVLDAQTNNGYRYKLRLVQSLVGGLEADRLEVYFDLPIMERGELRISRIIPQSGIEFELKKDQEYVFLFRDTKPDSTGALYLLRAEPLSRQGEVVTLWKKAEENRAH